MATTARRRIHPIIVLSCLAVSAALCPGVALASVTRVLTLGPIQAGHRFSATVVDVGCGTAANRLTVRYAEAGAGVGGIAHVYAGPSAICRLPTGRRAGEIRGSWGRALALDLRLTPIRRQGVRAGGVPLGCAGAAGGEGITAATGRLRLAIHPKVWGAWSSRLVNGSVLSVRNLDCRSTFTPAASDVTLLATAPDQLLVAQSASATKSVVALVDYARDIPARHVSGQMIVALQGASEVFQAGPLLRGARVGSVSPFTSGSLWFTALPLCPGFPGALNGVLTGALTVYDPVLGPVRFAGSAARSASLAFGSAVPGKCNGLGVGL